MDYYVFDDLDLDLIFNEVEIAQFLDYWRKGYSLKTIADKLRRKPLEIGLLVLDRAEVGEIIPRPTGIQGKEEEVGDECSRGEKNYKSTKL